MPADSRFRWLALGLISLGALAADQFSKHAVEKYTAVGSLRVVIPGLLNLVHTTNSGVAFGLFADSENPWRGPLLITFSVAVIAMLLWLLATGRAGGRFGRMWTRPDFGRRAGKSLRSLSASQRHRLH